MKNTVSYTSSYMCCCCMTCRVLDWPGALIDAPCDTIESMKPTARRKASGLSYDKNAPQGCALV